MKNYIIKNVQCDITEGGIACGPVSGNVVATVEVFDGEKTFFLTEVEVTGIPNFYYTEEDKFAEFLAEDFDDEEWCDYMDNSYISEFEGIELGDYDDIFESIEEDQSVEAKLIKYIISVIRMGFEEMNEFIDSTVGKSIAEIQIPNDDSDIIEDSLEGIVSERIGCTDEEKYPCSWVGSTFAVEIVIEHEGEPVYMTFYANEPEMIEEAYTKESIFEQLLIPVDFCNQEMLEDFDKKFDNNVEYQESFEPYKEYGITKLTRYMSGQMDIDVEDEEEEVELPEDFEELCKLRLQLETTLEYPNVYLDMDSDNLEDLKSVLEKATDSLEEIEYNEWKNEFIETKYQEIKDQEFLTCSYLFAGFGSYEMIFPKEELEKFKQWINGNGSAFMGEPKPSTEEEIKRYICLNPEEV